jgi:hypothetical protein
MLVYQRVNFLEVWKCTFLASFCHLGFLQRTATSQLLDPTRTLGDSGGSGAWLTQKSDTNGDFKDFNPQKWMILMEWSTKNIQ